MSVIAEVEGLALALPASDRGKLANKLIASLPSPGWDDEDDGYEIGDNRFELLRIS